MQDYSILKEPSRKPRISLGRFLLIFLAIPAVPFALFSLLAQPAAPVKADAAMKTTEQVWRAHEKFVVAPPFGRLPLAAGRLGEIEQAACSAARRQVAQLLSDEAAEFPPGCTYIDSVDEGRYLLFSYVETQGRTLRTTYRGKFEIRNDQIVGPVTVDLFAPQSAPAIHQIESANH